MPTTDGQPDQYAQGYRDGYRDGMSQARTILSHYNEPRYGPYSCPDCKVRPGQAHWDNCRQVPPFAQTTWMGWK